MISHKLIRKLFEAFFMQRWNDKIRPMPLIEIDKQAHKMFIAYFIAKFEENQDGFDWIKIIEGSIFELLQRIVLTDIKPPIFYLIKQDKDKYKQLNEYVYNDLKDILESFDKEFAHRFKEYFNDQDNKDKTDINRKILNAAHHYASIMEFNIIKQNNPNAHDIEKISNEFEKIKESHLHLEGFKNLIIHKNYQDFINICGQLRFQIRWANIYRNPKTSVLGHSLFVAMVSYLFSYLENCSPKRSFNNYFSGLFHDLPEVLTRDIISPIKKSVEGLSDFIKEYEKQQMQTVVYPLLPKFMLDEIIDFTENEFETRVYIDNKKIETTTNEISSKYNEDKYNPKDGKLIKTADELAAFLEAYYAIENGSKNVEFKNAISNIIKKYEYLTFGSIKPINIFNKFKFS